MGHPGAALNQLGTSVATSSFSDSHRLRHTPTTEFQPPYFPPPYSVPQQPGVEFSHHHMNPDPYAHLGHYNTQHHQQQINYERHHLFGNDPLNSFNRGLSGPYDARRDYDVSVSRPDVLMAPRAPHELHSGALLGIGAPQGLTGLEEHDHHVSKRLHTLVYDVTCMRESSYF